MNQLKGNILITGGAGYLGRAIVRRAMRKNWDCAFTILSRDTMKHHHQQQDLLEFKTNRPFVRWIVGDICDYDGLSKSIAGHDVVIHAGALKHIPECESNPEETMRVNYEGSLNVASACIRHGVKQCIGISTDKACHPINIYGASKLAMERVFQKYNGYGVTAFHLCRYGNVLSSTGSFLTDWKRKLAQNPNRIETTSADMSRFWLSVEQAVDVILLALSEPAGTITIPKLPAASMDAIESWYIPEGTEIVHTGLRLGEKRHEELLTLEEADFWEGKHNYMRLHPVTGYAMVPPGSGRGCYSSDTAPQLTREQFEELLK